MGLSLHEIGIKSGTDKAGTHFYMDNYEKYLSPLQYNNITLLEIGVGNGSSIKMWREYFANGRVVGIDNNPGCAGEDIFIGSQVDKLFLNHVLKNTGCPYIIIDDGSHYGPYTIETFKYLFPKMAQGGYYVVEDTACFYDKTYGEAPPFGQGMSEVFKFFTSLACDVDVHGRGYTGNTKYALELENPNFAPVPEYSPILDSIHIHPSLWFFKRKP